jgi:hypothetical protein
MNDTIHSVRDNPTASEPPAGGATPPGGRDEPGRVQHLFRVLTRLGLVHPLQHLILRYRAGERA